VVFDEGKIKTYTLDSMIKRLKDILARVRRGDITSGGAFAYAADFAMSLIAKGLFAHLEPLAGKAAGIWMKRARQAVIGKASGPSSKR